MPLPPSRVREGPARSGGWGVAILAALFMHTTALLSLVALASRAAVGAGPDARASAIAVELVRAPRPAQPRAFTELPEDRAGPKPDSPVLLSNVDSQARDRIPGGDEGSLPRMDGSAESPQIATTEAATAAAPTPVPRDSRPESPSDASTRDAARPETGGPANPSPLDVGLASALQDAMANAVGNAPQFGDISLSTTAWEYAPWLMAFRRALLERWTVPSAYSLGLLHGWALIEVEVGRDGRLLRLDVLADDVTHWSLTDAAANALRRAAPYRPLPASFPDETLVVQIRFTYPRWRR